jgi:hypothetical protein
MRHHRVTEVAAIYAVTRETVLAWIANGELVPTDVSRCRNRKRPTWRISDAALARFDLLRAKQAIEVSACRRRRRKDSQMIEYFK